MALLIVALILAGGRLALPYAVKALLNAKLSALEGGYAGRVEDVRLALWRGAISLRGLSIKQDSTELLLKIPALDVNLSWGPLLRRMLVADVELARPDLSMRLQRAEAAAQTAAKETKEEIAKQKVEHGTQGQPLSALLAALLPFRIDSFTVTDGALRLRDERSGQEAVIDEIQFSAGNLTNRPKRSDEGGHARAKASAKVLDSGTLGFALRLNPLASRPEFTAAFDVKDVELAEINPILRAQFGMDVEKGRFEMVGEASAADGGFSGYVKPFVEDLVLPGKSDKGKGALKKIKEAVVGAVASALKNRESEAVAAKIDFEGKFEKPEIGAWEAVLSVLRNAFVTALKPTFEGVAKPPRRLAK